MIVAVVVVALAVVSAVSELRVFLTDRIADAPAALAPAVTITDRARVVPETSHNAALSRHIAT